MCWTKALVPKVDRTENLLFLAFRLILPRILETYYNRLIWQNFLYQQVVLKLLVGYDILVLLKNQQFTTAKIYTSAFLLEHQHWINFSGPKFIYSTTHAVSLNHRQVSQEQFTVRQPETWSNCLSSFFGCSCSLLLEAWYFCTARREFFPLKKFWMALGVDLLILTHKAVILKCCAELKAGETSRLLKPGNFWLINPWGWAFKTVSSFDCWKSQQKGFILLLTTPHHFPTLSEIDKWTYGQQMRYCLIQFLRFFSSPYSCASIMWFIILHSSLPGFKKVRVHNVHLWLTKSTQISLRIWITLFLLFSGVNSGATICLIIAVPDFPLDGIQFCPKEGNEILIKYDFEMEK